MECTFMQEVVLGSFSLVLGQILSIHVHDEAVIDPDATIRRRQQT